MLLRASRTRSGSTASTGRRGRCTPCSQTLLPRTESEGDSSCCTTQGSGIDGDARAATCVFELSRQLWRRLLAEYLGSLLLAAIVIGSGHRRPDALAARDRTRAPRKCGGHGRRALRPHPDVWSDLRGALQSGHLLRRRAVRRNLVARARGPISCAQVAGCVSGAILANADVLEVGDLTVDGPPSVTGARVVRGRRDGGPGPGDLCAGQTGSGALSRPPLSVPTSRAAYFFTSSTSFANPAIVVGRMFSNSFAGIAPASSPLFVGAEVVGGLLAVPPRRALFVDVDGTRRPERDRGSRSRGAMTRYGDRARNTLPLRPQRRTITDGRRLRSCNGR